MIFGKVYKELAGKDQLVVAALSYRTGLKRYFFQVNYQPQSIVMLERTAARRPD